jgi:hypothetical protein
MLIRKIRIFLTACVEGILQLFVIFYLHRKFSVFLRNNHDCKAESYDKHILASELFL